MSCHRLRRTNRSAVGHPGLITELTAQVPLFRHPLRAPKCIQLIDPSPSIRSKNSSSFFFLIYSANMCLTSTASWFGMNMLIKIVSLHRTGGEGNLGSEHLQWHLILIISLYSQKRDLKSLFYSNQGVASWIPGQDPGIRCLAGSPVGGHGRQLMDVLFSDRRFFLPLPASLSKNKK